jgi:cell division transport system permease protein
MIREALLSLKKHKFITFTTIAVLTFNLLILGIFAILMLNLNLFLESIKENVEVTLFLKENLPKEEIDKLLIEVKAIPGIDNCRFISKEEALKEFSQTDELKEYIATLKVNPLPDSIIVNINKNYKNIAKLEKLVESLKTISNVSEVHYKKEETEKLLSIVNAIKSIIFGLSLILIISSILIISNTIRVNIFVKKEDMKAMDLSGVSKWFIKGIVVIECVIECLVASIFATILLYILEKVVYTELNILWSGRWLSINYKFVLFMILLGVTLGLLSSLLFRVKYYLK